MFWKLPKGSTLSVTGMLGYLFNTVNMMALVGSLLANLKHLECDPQERVLVISYLGTQAVKLLVIIGAGILMACAPKSKFSIKVNIPRSVVKKETKF